MAFAKLAAAAAVATSVAGGTWSVAPSLPSPRSAHAVTVANGAIYVLGGPANRNVDRFDGHAWRTVSKLPGGALNAPAAVTLGSRIYVIGGFSGTTNEPTSAVRVFDPASRKWSTAQPLPAPRGGHAAVVLDGKIHVLGGGNDVSTLADHLVFDPKTNAWTTLAPLPRSEGSVAAVVSGGRIYAIGGRSGFDDYGDTYVYDAAADRWSRGPSIPPRGTAGAAVLGNAIYAFGGESQPKSAVLGDVYRLRSGAARWERVGHLPHARNYARAVVFRKLIYVVGGSRSPGDVHSAPGSRLVERYRPG
jgi:N-acetylneuraminic acid mutarotase